MTRLTFALITMLCFSVSSFAQESKTELYSVGQVRFSIGQNYLKRSIHNPDKGSVTFLLRWPDLEPAEEVIKGQALESSSGIQLSIEPADGLSAAERARQLYPRFFEGEKIRVADGLVRRDFRANTPYADDYMIMDEPPSGLIVALCPKVQPQNIPSTCLATYRFRGNLDIQVRFAAENITQLRSLIIKTQALVQGWAGEAAPPIPNLNLRRE